MVVTTETTSATTGAAKDELRKSYSIDFDKIDVGDAKRDDSKA